MNAKGWTDLPRKSGTMQYGFLTRFHESEFVHSVEQAVRRQSWLFDGITFSKAANFALAGWAFFSKRASASSYPLILKMDISPLCNLRCPVCVHARPDPRLPLLAQQRFKSSDKMPVQRFARVVEEVKDKTLALSLYYLGDPYMHPDLDEMCTIARSARLNVHVSSNFSFGFSDDRIASIARSGLTHLSVCIDGIEQATYGRTRIGGDLDRVLSNLKRLCQFKAQHRLRYPKIEVQTLRFDHNLPELASIRRMARSLGVDETTEYAGMTTSWIEQEPEYHTTLRAKSTRVLPQCFWPYVSMVIKYNGDVLPCCYHRQGKQYTNHPDKRIVGNVFESSVAAVWNSQEYRRLRGIVANPGRAARDGASRGSFCEDCRYIFETVPRLARSASRGSEPTVSSRSLVDERKRQRSTRDGVDSSGSA